MSHPTVYVRPGHGTRALVADFIEDRRIVGRAYGRRMMRHLRDRCVECWFADLDRARIRRMHSAYGRRAR